MIDGLGMAADKGGKTSGGQQGMQGDEGCAVVGSEGTNCRAMRQQGGGGRVAAGEAAT